MNQPTDSELAGIYAEYGTSKKSFQNPAAGQIHTAVSAAQWDGLPENPERDGWHWLRTPAGEAPYGWFARRWEASEGEYDPVEDCSYIGRGLTRAEVAVLVEQARREERETAAKVVEARCLEVVTFPQTGVWMRDVLKERAAAIRARAAT